MCSVLASQTSAHNAQAQSVKCVKCVRPCAFRSDGPLTQSLGGSQYILAVLDDASRFSWIECIEHKSDAASSLIATIKNCGNVRRRVRSEWCEVMEAKNFVITL